MNADQINEFISKTHNKEGVDRSLLLERLKLSPTQRLIEHARFMKFVEILSNAPKKEKNDQF